MPAGHDESHAAADVPPEVAENFPAAHGRHTEDMEAPILGEYVPAGHGVHVGDADDVAYFPAAHGAHIAPLACEVVPASQAVQTVAKAAPNSVAYLPAKHRVKQTSSPCIFQARI